MSSCQRNVSAADKCKQFTYIRARAYTGLTHS